MTAPKPRRPVFLPAAGYRRRRLRDAARVLPAFGAVLLLLPVLWGPGAGAERHAAGDANNLFAVWLAVIVAAFLLARRLSAETEGPAPGPDDED
jgi:hypothetical protein